MTKTTDFGMNYREIIISRVLFYHSKKETSPLVYRDSGICTISEKHKRLGYLNLLTSGRLNEYLASVNEQAENMFSQLIKEYADKQGVTERLKAENQLLWMQKMNNIRACVREIVDMEIIYL